MRTLVYKRTHTGDPDVLGRFGASDCMGQVRAWGFDAVIGVGGVGSEPIQYDIARKLNWIGVGPTKIVDAKSGHLIVTFDHFLDFGTEGPELESVAPLLAERICDGGVRAMMDFDDAVQGEIDRLLLLAADAPPSRGSKAPKMVKRNKCRPGRC